MSEKKIIYVEEEVDFFVEKVGCTKEEGYIYMQCQEEYFAKVGIINYEEGCNHKVNPEFVLNDNEMNEFICQRTSLPYELVAELTEADFEYLDLNGLVEEVVNQDDDKLHSDSNTELLIGIELGSTSTNSTLDRIKNGSMKNINK